MREETIKNYIKTDGIVSKIDDQYIYVKLDCQSACSQCHAKGSCFSVEKSFKIIEVQKKNKYFLLKENDKVQVLLDVKSGFWAVLWGYIFPLILVLIVIIIGTYLKQHEGLVAFLSLIFLIPYYLLLKMMRNIFQKKYSFTIRE